MGGWALARPARSAPKEDDAQHRDAPAHSAADRRHPPPSPLHCRHCRRRCCRRCRPRGRPRLCRYRIAVARPHPPPFSVSHLVLRTSPIPPATILPAWAAVSIARFSPPIPPAPPTTPCYPSPPLLPPPPALPLAMPETPPTATLQQSPCSRGGRVFLSLQPPTALPIAALSSHRCSRTHRGVRPSRAPSSHRGSPRPPPETTDYRGKGVPPTAARPRRVCVLEATHLHGATPQSAQESAPKRALRRVAA